MHQTQSVHNLSCCFNPSPGTSRLLHTATKKGTEGQQPTFIGVGRVVRVVTYLYLHPLHWTIHFRSLQTVLKLKKLFRWVMKCFKFTRKKSSYQNPPWYFPQSELLLTGNICILVISCLSLVHKPGRHTDFCQYQPDFSTILLYSFRLQTFC